MLEKADIKIIDFDDFVFCTTESKSITFHENFSNISLLTRSSEATDKEYFDIF